MSMSKWISLLPNQSDSIIDQRAITVKCRSDEKNLHIVEMNWYNYELNNLLVVSFAE